MIEVRPVTLEDAMHVSRHMRAADWRELSALRFGATREMFAHEAMAAADRGPAAVIARDGVPVMVGGVALSHPGVASCWMWATDDFPKVAKTASKAARAFMAAMRESGVRRMQALSHAEHRAAHRWICFHGLREECRLAAYGADGSDFIMFSEVCDVHE